jgi:hypothetical protein
MGYDPQHFPDDSWQEGILLHRPMADGRAWCMIPLVGGRVRIVIVPDRFSMGEHW